MNAHLTSNIMKKSLLITLLFTLSLTVLAQQNPCAPDASFQDSTWGLWPDTIQNLQIAQTDTYYEEHIQIKTPTTVGEVMGDPYKIENTFTFFPDSINIAPLSISKIMLVQINGLPGSMSTYISSADSTFSGSSVGCVTLFGYPSQNDIGEYDLEILIDGEVSVPLGTTSFTTTLYENLGQYEVIPGYKFIVQSEPSFINENNKLFFSLSQNSPNPFSNRTSIEFNSSIEGEYLFSMVNLLGEVQDYRIINANYGSNKIDIDASALSSGIYFYSLSNTQGMITKKMIINKD